MKKRIVALLLCCVMLLTLSPSLIATATADDENSGAAQQVEQTGETKDTDPQPDQAKAEDKNEAQPTEGEGDGNGQTGDNGQQTNVPDQGETGDQTGDGQKDAAPAFDVKAAYDALMACATVEDMIALSNKLTDEQIAMFSDEQIAALNAKYDALMPEAPEETDEGNGIVNFTDVAPFLAPVSGSSVRRAAARGVSTKAASNGVELNKTAVKTGDGYKITLEAFATGASSVVSSQTPTDIVLVLDQSGSMAHCIVCGAENLSEHRVDTYTEILNPDTGSIYYIKDGSGYQEVKYCNGKHVVDSYKHAASWVPTNLSNIGPAHKNYISDHGVIPDNGTPLYTRSSKWENCTSRLSALKSAVTSFTNAVAEKAAGADKNINTTEDNIHHRIAIVGFGTDDRGGSGNPDYENTELFIGASSYQYGGNQIASQYGKALQDMSTTQGKNNITSSIGKLAASGGTAIDLGTEMANNVLKAYQNDTGRNKVVIVFTDGIPGIWDNDGNTTRNGYANRAINNTHTSKDTYGATVYTIGVFGGADASNPGSLTTDTDWSNDAVANKFMHLMSSNYPDATSMTVTGNVKSDLSGKSYYLSAGNANALDNIFQQISNEVGGSATQLDDKATIKDIVTPYFTMPANATDVKLYTAKSNGSTDSWKDRENFDGTVTLNTEDNSVSVSGFSFKDNWCGTHTDANGTQTFHDGKKLIIEFTVKAKADFLGGNDVPTNGTDSGIYDKDGTSAGKFDVPTVNVPIEPVTVTAQDKNVYLLGSVTADDLKSGAEISVGDVKLDLSKATDTNKPYGLDPWQTEYVDITVTVKDATGKDVTGNLTNLTDDTTYTVAVTVAPKTKEPSATSSGQAAVARDGNSSANIYVFKPELTFKDSTAYYGETVPANNNYSGNQVGAEKWMHDGTEAVPSEMLGEKPTLDISYTPDESKLKDGKYTKQDVPVSATVKINGTDVTGKTTFVHQDCTDKTCTLPTGYHFWIHVKTCQLTITKQGGDAGEPYVFTVKKDGEKYTEVTIKGGKSETIYELPVGTYTIEENTKWSWRYPSPTYSDNVTLSAGQDSGAITCTNKPDNNKWLNGFSDVVTNTFGAAHN